jgi:hypothetical protein
MSRAHRYHKMAANYTHSFAKAGKSGTVPYSCKAVEY